MRSVGPPSGDAAPAVARAATDLSPRRRGAARPAELIGGARGFGRRHRALITVAGSVLAAAALVFVLGGRREEFTTALSGAAASVLVATVLLQIVGLVLRSEA